MESLIGEELGWGDAGLAVSLSSPAFHMQMAAVIVGNQELVDLCTGKHRLLDDHASRQGQ